jgi:hypothetical protein
MKPAATLAAATVAIALVFPSAASADRKFFNVTVGGPGYAVSVGSAGVGVLAGAPFYPALAPVVVAPPVFAPVVVAPPLFAPVPVVVAPPVVYRAHRPHRVVRVAPSPLAYLPPAAHRPWAPVAPVPYRAVAPVRYVSAAPY